MLVTNISGSKISIDGVVTLSATAKNFVVADTPDLIKRVNALRAAGKVTVSGSDFLDVVAGENIAANKLVNIYTDSNVTKARLASNADSTKPCSGFVTEAVAAGKLTRVYTDGFVAGTSLPVGKPVFLGADGDVLTSESTTPGATIQPVGMAVSPESFEFDISSFTVVPTPEAPPEPTYRTGAASEALTANTLVNMFDDAGTIKVRKADATTNKPCTGFIKDDFDALDTVQVYFDGFLEGTALTVGTMYYLGSAGAISDTAPVAAGSIVQPIGMAVSATDIEFDADTFSVVPAEEPAQ